MPSQSKTVIVHIGLNVHADQVVYFHSTAHLGMVWSQNLMLPKS
jgi:hypothetical protein